MFQLHIARVVVGVTRPRTVERSRNSEVRQGLPQEERTLVAKICSLGCRQSRECRLTGRELGPRQLTRSVEINTIQQVPAPVSDIVHFESRVACDFTLYRQCVLLHVGIAWVVRYGDRPKLAVGGGKWE